LPGHGRSIGLGHARARISHCGVKATAAFEEYSMYRIKLLKISAVSESAVDSTGCSFTAGFICHASLTTWRMNAGSREIVRHAALRAGLGTIACGHCSTEPGAADVVPRRIAVVAFGFGRDLETSLVSTRISAFDMAVTSDFG
jgi:hypothetical protein